MLTSVQKRPYLAFTLHNFSALEPDEVSFPPGVPILVVEKDEEYQDSWYKGMVLVSPFGSTAIEAIGGLFPANFIGGFHPKEYWSSAEGRRELLNLCKAFGLIPVNFGKKNDLQESGRDGIYIGDPESPNSWILYFCDEQNNTMIPSPVANFSREATPANAVDTKPSNDASVTPSEILTNSTPAIDPIYSCANSPLPIIPSVSHSPFAPSPLRECSLPSTPSTSTVESRIEAIASSEDIATNQTELATEMASLNINVENGISSNSTMLIADDSQNVDPDTQTSSSSESVDDTVSEPKQLEMEVTTETPELLLNSNSMIQTPLVVDAKVKTAAQKAVEDEFGTFGKSRKIHDIPNNIASNKRYSNTILDQDGRDAGGRDDPVTDYENILDAYIGGWSSPSPASENELNDQENVAPPQYDNSIPTSYPNPIPPRFLLGVAPLPHHPHAHDKEDQKDESDIKNLNQRQHHDIRSLIASADFSIETDIDHGQNSQMKLGASTEVPEIIPGGMAGYVDGSMHRQVSLASSSGSQSSSNLAYKTRRWFDVLSKFTHKAQDGKSLPQIHATADTNAELGSNSRSVQSFPFTSFLNSANKDADLLTPEGPWVMFCEGQVKCSEGNTSIAGLKGLASLRWKKRWVGLQMCSNERFLNGDRVIAEILIGRIGQAERTHSVSLTCRSVLSPLTVGKKSGFSVFTGTGKHDDSEEPLAVLLPLQAQTLEWVGCIMRLVRTGHRKPMTLIPLRREPVHDLETIAAQIPISFKLDQKQ